MYKFDVSTGLSAKEIDTIKYNIKKKVTGLLPELPDVVETKLFLQGRNPWNFYWKLLNSNVPLASNEDIAIEATAKLKREFHRYGTKTQHTFLCNVRTTEDEYHPSVSIKQIA
ncbi:MAG: hypothetical protein N838_03670 [Thiohalocapsa sp. PB-PSB1]|jgi:hypothetical protein|nr:MAG: hypothetical protein N838_03670 [Thiohalocapsa sp. PB-PSB1]